MKKLLIYFILAVLFFVPNCYAAEDNIIIESIKKKDSLVVDFLVSSKTSYGFSTKLEYDSSKMKLNSCVAYEGFEITYNKNYIVVENINGTSGKKIATCKFDLIKDSDTEIKVKNIISSDYKKAVDSGAVQLKLSQGTEEVIIKDIPNTAAGATTFYIVFGLVCVSVGVYLIVKFMNKNFFEFICMFLFLIIPFSTYAEIDKSNLSSVDLSNIRKMLLNEKSVDTELDVDGDKKITINDLVITKIDLHAISVDFEVLSDSVRNSAAKSNVYLSLKQKFSVTSASDIESVKYCVGYQYCIPSKL